MHGALSHTVFGEWYGRSSEPLFLKIKQLNENQTSYFFFRLSVDAYAQRSAQMFKRNAINNPVNWFQDSKFNRCVVFTIMICQRILLWREGLRMRFINQKLS